MENHDNPRFPSLTSDISLAKNAIAFTILADGIPMIYYGQEQHFAGGAVPNDREALWLSGYSTTSTLYTHIAATNKIRSRAIAQSGSYLTYKAYPVYSDSSTIVMRKGATNYQIVGVFSNLGVSGGTYTLNLPASDHGFIAGQSLVEILSCTAYTTDSSGNLALTMSGGLPRILYPVAQLSGSGICTTTTTAPGGGSGSCPSSVAISFTDKVTTTYGETMRVAGNVAQLGNWNTGNAVTLSASGYTSSNPIWSGTVQGFSPGEVVQYKYINVGTDGSATWEADPNHTYTVPSCTATASVSNMWQS